MKKSTRYIWAAAVLAILWTLFFGYLASSVIQAHLSGKDSSLAHTYQVPAK